MYSITDKLTKYLNVVWANLQIHIFSLPLHIHRTRRPYPYALECRSLFGLCVCCTNCIRADTQTTVIVQNKTFLYNGTIWSTIWLRFSSKCNVLCTSLHTCKRACLGSLVVQLSSLSFLGWLSHAISGTLDRVFVLLIW